VKVNPTNTAFTLVNDSTGGSTISGFIINNPHNGTGINISTNDCTIKIIRLTVVKQGSLFQEATPQS